MATTAQGPSMTAAQLPPMTRRARTFFGCLTCRKRKVKCDSQQSPCKNCSRLRIPCTPSFHSNFKNANLEVAQDDRGTNARFKGPSGDPTAHFNSHMSIPEEGARPCKRQMVSHEDISLVDNGGMQPGATMRDLPSTYSSPDDNHIDDIIDKPSTEQEDLNTWSSGQTPSIFSYDVDYVVYDLGFQQWQTDGVSSSVATGFEAPKSFDIMSPGVNTGRILDLDKWLPPGRVNTPQWEGGSLYETSGGSVSADSSLATMNSADMGPMSPLAGVVPPKAFQTSAGGTGEHWGIPPQVPQPRPADTALIRHYESTMSTFFSVKSPQWNLYTYMLRSPQGSTNSPLRSSILAWTSAHLSRRDDNPLINGAIYYTHASNAVKDLMRELSSTSRSTTGNSTSNNVKLYIVLSTSFFLSHCDFMTCDRRAFSERLNELKLIITQNWDSLRNDLGSLASRLLIWLAYLDLRASLWGNSSPVSRIGDAQNRLPVLLDMLGDLKALPSLRSVSDNKSYLSDCFGDAYPSTELREDLVQEPVNAKSDDIMCVLSRVRGFETWNDEMIRRGAYEEDAAVRELRESKVKALRAEIASIRAECESTFPDRLDTGTDVDRTSFHCLTVSALHLSATILLNRILEPNVRTDEESQRAAQGICKIAHQLRRTACLRTPRSLIWPLPIFIAGIETADVIYQDWILEYMAEMEDWGANMKTMRALLRKMLTRQERENRRVKVRDVMDDFDLGMIL